MLCRRDAGEDHGLSYGAMLLYSGNFEAQVEKSQFGDARLVLGVGTQHFSFRLEPGDHFTTPEAAMVCSPNGFTPMSQQFHRAIRTHLCRDPYAGRRRPVLINNWEATYFDFTPEKLLEMAKTAADLGLELFVLDDGWFGHRDDDFGGLGDWWVNREKLPMGLRPLAEQMHKLGMQFGIWVEPEMVSEDSQLYAQHPDWVLAAPHRPPARGRSQLVLDLSRPQVQEYLLEVLENLLSSAPISYMKWDMNRSLSDVWSAALPPDRQGEVYHRYVLGVYQVLEQLRTRHPDLLIEGCSGGGGRFDGGMLYYCPQIWCSDNTDAMDRLRIQYGTSFCYPVSTMGAHVAAVPNHQTGRVTPLATRGVVAMSGTFGYEMDLSQATEAEKQEMAQQIKTFKAHAQLIANGDYYRLTDPFQPGPFTAWAIVSPDKREALVSVVSGSTHAAQPFWALHLRGLDPALDYRWGENIYPGDGLMAAGLPIDLGPGDYQSQQFYFTAI
jgi:alpha-galactosidase